jgi:indolepyruvate ferredoxin oxidoreductase
LGGQAPELVEATELATALLGDSIATNLFMLGYAWQKGLVPVSFEALIRAIELNDAAVEANKKALQWGRLAAHDIARVRAAANPPVGAPEGATALALSPLDDRRLTETLDDAIARRVQFLTDYQNSAYAAKYQSLVAKVRSAEKDKTPALSGLTEAVARYAFKLMAYKDEYEVARLYTAPQFMRQIRETFDGDYKIAFNLAPPLFAKRDENGHLVKQEFGPWMFGAFKLVAKLKGLRGTALDVFGYSAERREERRLVDEYFTTVEQLSAKLSRDNYATAVEIAQIPEQIRGYGHVKQAHLAKAKARRAELLGAFETPMPEAAAMAAA